MYMCWTWGICGLNDKLNKMKYKMALGQVKSMMHNHIFEKRVAKGICAKGMIWMKVSYVG